MNEWPWIWILAPLWIPVLIVATISIATGIVSLVAGLVGLIFGDRT